MNDKVTFVEPPVATAVELQFLGQAGVRLRHGEAELIVDPYLSDSVAASSAEPELWQRRFPPPVQPGQLDRALAVACTHEHRDHVDADTLAAILDASPGAALLLPEAAEVSLPRRVAQRARHSRGEGDLHHFGPFTITSVPAAHSQRYTTETGERGHRWQGFVVEVGGRRIYHAGDTVRYDGQLEAVLARGPLDLAILPVNGRDPYRERHDVVGNLWPREAVELALELGVPSLVPCHHDLFRFNGIAVGAVADYAAEQGARLDVRCLTAGAWTELAARHPSPAQEGGPS